MLRSELFIFDYGVVVFWNWSPEEEAYFRRLLAQFATHPFKVDDIEVEDFHFQYDLNGPIQPRIFNDMITLKSASPLIKLTISHACAQSVKLTLYENMMEETIEGTLPLPQMLSKYGEVKMSRNDVMRIIGKLFSLRMEVNLVSNVLDTPEIFWFEPELDGLYNAIRGYLEISQRAVVLNSRASVLSDMLSMLSEHMNSKEMTNITVIIILLILLACVIAVAEVYVKVLRVRAGME
ncbi:hypothetical protein CXG81DRAFT_10546 [Caulochytrium protostelioides]|uniref:DUF155 domain-containing protein n=1 Tax=Caulochytrium protostelioides TaxID=1555241 RepID=A0A4P9XB85_9FUNG|nr:hypothetical protein CXG81DRAFT_10546 [Caulochytrium protostelioides]|eukprot:RKP02632.1 hypothetical protein CXG81DRAFT_10546 [Caulochytrium protostelioides]